MDLSLKPEHKAFADEVRAFARENLSPATREKTFSGKHYDRDDHIVWQKALGKKGWLAYTWPKKYGGPGWDVTQRFLFENVLAEEGAPRILPFGPKMVGPVIYTFGTEAQKERFLPGIRSSEVSWCQGYSEPGAGSDLANLRTRAVREGDHYIVNGQKTWTTLGHFADWIFVLCRTDPAAKKPQEGISFILVDMKTPGVEVRPIITMDGGHEVNETWFTDVKVPVANLVGKENEGWTYAKYLLAHERTGIAGVARSKKGIERLREIASVELDQGQPIIRNPDFAKKISELEIDLSALEYTELRTLAREAQGKGPGPESSILKIKGTEIQQRITELTLEAVGVYGAPYFRGFPEDGDNQHPIGPEYAHLTAPMYANMRKTSIYGGSNEIQHNIIAKMVLGL